jgi:hypothetical protein
MSLAVLVASPGVTRRWMTPKLAAADNTARTSSAVPATSADRRIPRFAGGGVCVVAAALLLEEGAGRVVIMA